MKRIKITKKFVKEMEYFGSKFVPCYPAHLNKLLLVDFAAIRQLIDKYKVSSVLEIGTWRGYGTLMLWLAPSVNYVATMDICKDYEGTGASFHNSLPQEQYGEYVRLCDVKRITCDSGSYTPGPEEKYDMVFIDGNHDKEPVLKDYALAEKVCEKIIVFHDIENGNPGVDAAINELGLEVNRFADSCVGWVAVEG